VKQGVDPAAAEKAIDAILDDVIKNGVTADELQRSKSRQTADFVRGIERLGGFGGRSDVLAESMTYGGSPDAYLTNLETMATATAADVNKAAKAWLDTNHYTLVVRPFPSLAPGKTTVDRKVLPSLGAAPEVQFPAIQRTTLSNGLKVMLLERHSAPLVNMSLAVDAGYAADPAPKAGLAGLTLDVMDEGTATRDTFAIVNELDSLGATIGTGNSLDMSFVTLSALPANLGKSLDVFADVVLHPAFATDMVALAKRQRIARIAQEQANPVASVNRIVPRLIYGANHAYAKPLTGTGYVETLKGVERQDLVEWHKSWFVPGNATLIVTGDVTMDKLKPALESAFGSWKDRKSVV